MNAMNETSPTKAADPVPVFMASTLDMSMGSAVFTGLKEVEAMCPTPDTRGSDATSDNSNIIGPNDRYVASVDPTPSTHLWIESPMILCRWCGYMLKFGRGPVEHLDFCSICKSEVIRD